MIPKVFFNHEIFTKQKVGGVSNYFFNLGLNMIETNTDVKFFAPLHRNEYFLKINKNNKFGLNLKYIPGKLNYILDNLNFYIAKKYLKRNSYNLIHQTYYSKKVFPYLPKILTVFDMITEKFPKYFDKIDDITELKKKSIQNSDHLICISQNTKKDLIDYFGVDPNKISVTLLASNLWNEFIEIKKKKFRNIILYVGNRRGYKNFDFFVKSYSNSNFIKSNFKIGIYGGEKFNKIDYEILRNYNLDKNNFYFFDSSKFDLSFIYSNVSVLVYPSLYEGFGLPVVEAMSCGCPVICGTGGSLLEVGGQGLKYLDYNDSNSLTVLLENLLNSEQEQEKNIEYGYLRSKNFSWKKCSNETLKIYKEILVK